MSAQEVILIESDDESGPTGLTGQSKGANFDDEIVITDSDSDEIQVEEEIYYSDVQYLCRGRGSLYRNNRRNRRNGTTLPTEDLIRKLNFNDITSEEEPKEEPKEQPEEEPEKELEEELEEKSEELPEKDPDEMPEEVLDKELDHKSEEEPEKEPNEVPEELPDKELEDKSEVMPEELPEKDPDEMQEEVLDKELDDKSEEELEEESEEMPEEELDKELEDKSEEVSEEKQPMSEWYKCSFDGCDKYFNEALLHYLHEKNHSKELIKRKIKTFKCRYIDCPFLGLTQTELMYHNSEHRGIFLCHKSECIFRGKSAEDITKHMISHRRKGSKRPLRRKGIYCDCGEPCCSITPNF